MPGFSDRAPVFQRHFSVHSGMKSRAALAFLFFVPLSCLGTALAAAHDLDDLTPVRGQCAVDSLDQPFLAVLVQLGLEDEEQLIASNLFH